MQILILWYYMVKMQHRVRQLYQPLRRILVFNPNVVPILEELYKTVSI